MTTRERTIFGICILVLVLEFFLLMDIPAFWDAKSKFLRANWLFESDFEQLVVPTEYNSGHPPLWIWSIALFWKVLGKAIWSARLLLLIVNIGVVYQLLSLFKKTKLPKVPEIVFLLLFIEPTLVAQTTSLNNDMLLLFFSLLGMNSLLKNNWIWYAVGITGLLFTNLRGIYISIAFICIHILYMRYAIVESKRKMYYSYGVALSIFLLFLMYQYQELGWILITKNESYSQHRESTTLFNAFKNSIAFVKNLFEYGRFVIWVPLLFLLITHYKKHKKMGKQFLILLIPLCCFLGIFFIGMVPFSNPMGTRYLMISNLIAILLFFNLLYLRNTFFIKKQIVVFIVAISFITGHLWIYPVTIAQSWDSSLAHMRYFKLENKMLAYIQQENIPTQTIGTNLPMHTRWIAYVKETPSEENNFASPDIKENEYYLFSNIENKTGDEDIVELKTHWDVVQEYTSMGVEMILYRKHHSNL